MIGFGVAADGAGVIGMAVISPVTLPDEILTDAGAGSKVYCYIDCYGMKTVA